jgi:hypothetical protein
MISSMAVLCSYWLCLPVRWVRCSWPCGIHGNGRHSYVVCVHNFLLLCRLFVRYHVCLPTHLLTNTALYCTMTTLNSLSRLDDHQEDEICSDLACLRLCCRGTYVLHDHVMKIHRHAVDGDVTNSCLSVFVFLLLLPATVTCIFSSLHDNTLTVPSMFFPLLLIGDLHRCYLLPSSWS